MPTQLEAVSGRRIRPRYTDIINAKTPYLLPMAKMKADEDYNQMVLDQREREIAANTALARDQLEQEKKEAKTANLIGLANLGITAGLGAYREGLFGGGDKDLEGGSSPNVFSKVKELFGPSKIGGALKEPTNLVAGGVGALTSQLAGKDRSTIEKVIMGGGAAGITDLLLGGGDPYDFAVSIGMGALGGLF